MKRLFLLSIVCCFAIFSYSQTENIIYQCDFENVSEHNNWELNVGNQGKVAPNKWYFGKSGSNGGDYGLFVSKDGVSNDYSDDLALSVVCFRDSILLDKGEYELSFDWQAAGWQDSITNIDGLYVCWVPVTEKTNSLNDNEEMPEYIEKYALDFWGKGKKLSQSTWNTVIDTIVSDGTYHKLVFVWRNGMRGVYSPAACVDNILLMPVGYCYKPYNLNVELADFNVLFSWSGEAEAYDVRCYNERTKKWKTFENVRDTSIVIEGMEEGMCTYYVRSRCEGINGTWMSVTQFVYYAGTRCIDYMSLSSQNCFTGVNPVVDANAKFTPGCVDKGHLSIESRHTLHYDLEERDPRTGGGLKTVPDGEVASVRLGNWNTGGEAERVEYKYKVDTSTSAILILKYAVVLQDPKHNEEWQPKFELEVLLSDGTPLDKKGCGEAKFTAGANTSGEGWHNSTVIGGWWKDWTTVSLNLREHDGEEVIVRLTTYDCAELGHFAYAYFTLNCASGELESSACGDAVRDTLKGPDGFLYRWYKESDPNNVLSEKQVYDIPTDKPDVYCLDVIQPTNDQCYYTLTTQGMQRYPTADFAYEATVENCENKVKFTNKSYVATKSANGDLQPSGLPCDVVWDFGDGSTSSNSNPAHYYPAVGGKYTVKLRASMNGKCEDLKEIEIVLPNVTDMRDTIYATICPGEEYKLRGEPYKETGVYADTIPTIFGCDSILVLNLTVLEMVEEFDTICSTDVYYVNGVQITESGRYPIKSSLGCDSIVKNVFVNESLVLDIDSVISVCATDDNIIIPYIEESGRLLEFAVEFADEALKGASVKNLQPEDGAMVVPMLKGVEPNRYKAKLSFGELACGGEDIDILLDVYYPDSVITQRWNDVLAVRNTEWNGGYDFVAYQWYKNNEVIDGATSSILYIEEGLETDAEYSVLLTRNDGVQEMVCAVVPIKFAESTEDAVIVFAVNNSSEVNVKTSDSANVKIWSSMGLLVGEYYIQEGDNVLSIDVLDGVYFAEVIFNNGLRKIERIIVR